MCDRMLGDLELFLLCRLITIVTCVTAYLASGGGVCSAGWLLLQRV